MLQLIHYNIQCFASVLYVSACHILSNLKVFDSLNGVSEHFTVYAKEDVPDNLHYKNNNRIPDIVIVVEQGWILKSVSELKFGDCLSHISKKHFIAPRLCCWD